MENQYFKEALGNFVTDFNYGGAIRHLVNHGYDAERIKREFNYPLSIDAIQKIIDDYKSSQK